MTKEDSIARRQWMQADLSMHIRSKINLTLEGSYVDTGEGTNFTEKMAKCLATGTFPIHIGQSGGYNRLKNWGFKGFKKSGINLDYDIPSKDSLTAEARSTKIKKISDVIESLDDNIDVEDICRQNYEWFHSGWYDYCEKQNEIEIERLHQTLSNL
jgi:hypothetical protein